MTDVELSDPEAARRWLRQGIGLTVAAAPSRAALTWCLELAADGQPLPPPGFVADVGELLLGRATPTKPNRPPAFPGGLLRAYEDHVLGKFYADRTFERAADFVRRLRARDQIRGIAYVIRQFREGHPFVGVNLSPAAIKSLLDATFGDLLVQSWEDAEGNLLIDQYRDLVRATRGAADILGPADLAELEHGLALGEFSQRLAYRQVVDAAARLEAMLPSAPPPHQSSRREAPARVFDEDAYPVGGFASIANRGSIESLLHSQLAYMETAADADRPDLFDVKFLRDELLYYSRDENQFLRRRRSFVIELQADLATARFKDPDAPYQRIVLVQALVVAVVRRLTAWLNAEALAFELVIDSSLNAEIELLELILRDEIEAGTVTMVTPTPETTIADRYERLSRRSLCRAVTIGAEPIEVLEIDRLTVAARPMVNGEPAVSAGLDGWGETINRLLACWV